MSISQNIVWNQYILDYEMVMKVYFVWRENLAPTHADASQVT